MKTKGVKMANRRLFSKNVIYSDDFEALGKDAKNLYFYLMLEADDDGFLSNINQVLKLSSASRESLDWLIERGFILRFRSGVCVVTHWHIHNKIPREKYTKTVFLEELAQVELMPPGIYRMR